MASEDTGDRPTILVVDDTPDNLTLVSNLFKTQYRVRVAISGEKALRIAFSASPPDLILLDVMMPVMDGYTVCQTLRNSPLTAHIPIIFLSAKSEVEDETRGMGMGAADYIAKPISPTVLLARVKAHLAAKAYGDLMRDQAAFLEAEVQRRVREVCARQGLAYPSGPGP